MHAKDSFRFNLGYTVSSGWLAWDKSKNAKIGCGTLAWTNKELETMIVNVLWSKYEQDMRAHAEEMTV